MITILIAGDENKAKEILGRILRQEGYSISGGANADDKVIKIMQEDSIKSTDSLKDTVVELEDALYKEKEGVLYKAIVEMIEKPLIEHTLEKTNGNQLKAARILGINRNTIRAKIKKLKIDIDKWKA